MTEIVYWYGAHTYAKERCEAFTQMMLGTTIRHFQTKASRAETLTALESFHAPLLLIDQVSLERFNREDLASCANYVIEIDTPGDPEFLPENMERFSSFSLHPTKNGSLYGWDMYLPPLDLVPSVHPLRAKVVVHFGNEDRHNLSYRVLRHLVQLAIPLEVAVCITPDYKGDITALKLLALGKSSTKVKEVDTPYQELSTGTILIGDGGFGAFVGAYLSKPYIALSQSDEEFDHMLELETYGIAHIGLGRKVKQSHLQHALMEFHLHPKKAEKQVELQNRWKERCSGESLVSFATKRLSVLQ